MNNNNHKTKKIANHTTAFILSNSFYEMKTNCLEWGNDAIFD